MKKIIAVLLMCATLLSLFACAKKKDDTTPKQLEDIPNAYVGDTVIADTVKLGNLEIIIKEQTFYIDGIKFAFSDFKDTDKLSMNFGDDMLDVYVSEGKLQKCVVTSGDNTVCTEYNIQGNGVKQTKSVLDDYGNAVLVCLYDESGKLQSFYEASFDERCNMIQKREYNASYDLIGVTVYEYDENDKPVRELQYGADLKLKEVN